MFRLLSVPPVPARPLALVLLAAALAGAGASAQTLTVGGRRCATVDPGVAQVLRSAETVRAYRARVGEGAALRAEEAPVVVPVAFHVLTNRGRGEVSDERIAAQVDVLNRAFEPVGFRFVLAFAQRVERPEWAEGLRIRSAQEAAMKRALALDPSVYLNVYTASLGLDYLGWAVLPDDAPEGDRSHGVVLHHATLPGGSAAPFNEGHTGTHEVGHWAGLLHTFDGGCSAPNDGVADTPWQRTATSGCPPARDSCPVGEYGPEAEGEDPVTNFMDYSDDACMTGFTAGQRVRAQALTRAHRPTLVAGGRALATVPSSAFGAAAPGVPVTAPLRVTNLTDAPLTVVSATSTSAAFAVGGGGLVVPPGGVGQLAVTFAAAEAGPYEGAIRVETSSPAVGTLVVPVSGAVAAAPAARLATAAVEAELLEGDEAEREVVLANAGGGPLQFEVADLPRGLAAVSPSSGTVPAGAEVRLAVTVSAVGLPGGFPDVPGGGPLVIETNDPARPRVEVPVRLTVLVRPTALAVAPAYPNPGRGRITVPLELPDDARVTVEVFDVRGRRVAVLADGAALEAGYPTLAWDASGAAPGLYVVRARSGAAVAVGRITVVR